MSDFTIGLICFILGTYMTIVSGCAIASVKSQDNNVPFEWMISQYAVGFFGVFLTLLGLYKMWTGRTDGYVQMNWMTYLGTGVLFVIVAIIAGYFSGQKWANDTLDKYKKREL